MIVTRSVTHFTTVLKRLRCAAGLTMYALAQRSGLSRQGLSRIESGMNQPAWDTVQRLALALGVDCTAFVDPTLELSERRNHGKRGRPRKNAESARHEACQ